MRVVVARAVLAACLVPSSAGAQTLSLTEAQALAQLAPEMPRVQSVRASVEVAQANALLAARWPNPRVSFNREAVAGVTEDMVTVSQVLPVTGRRGLEMRAAAARTEAATSRAAMEIRRLRADLRLAFADLWGAQVRERELGRSRDRFLELADVLARREAAGESAGFDRLRAEREGTDVEADRAIAAIERARAQATLGGFLATAAADVANIEAVAQNRTPAAVPPIEDLIARAEASHGELAAIQRELDAVVFAERAAGRQLVPEPEVVAGTKSSSIGAGDVGSVVSVHVALPLFDRSRPERLAAQARARQLRAEAEVFRRSLRARVIAWRSALVERRDAADRYRAAATASADQIERIAQVSYDAGERTILELLDAVRSASAARIRQAMLDAAVREAEIELEFVSGWETP